MSLVPALDLRPAGDAVAAPLHNLEAEQALLGCIICDNSAFERVDDQIGDQHFADPLHGRLYAEIAKTIRAGKLAEPTLLESRFRSDVAFNEVGGLQYLALLIRGAPPGPNAPDYAAEIVDMALRRRVAEIGAEASKAAHDFSLSGREVLEQAEAGLFTLGETDQVKQGFVTFSTALHGALTMTAAAFDRDGGLSGLSTGIVDLDQRLGGMHPSDLIILAARPSMGKTSLALNIAFNVAKRYRYETLSDGQHKPIAGGRVAVFSLEMSAEQLAMRLLAEASGTPSDKMRKGEIDANEFGRIRDAALLIENSPLWIDATGGIPIAKLAQRARRLKRSGGLDLIIVDYLQLITASNSRGGANRVEQLTEITMGLKALAKELDVPVLALSQLSRQVENREDKRPQLSDLRESGSIEQDADVVAFIYREEYYLARTEPKAGTEEHMKWEGLMSEARGRADLIIAKQRHGPIGTVRLAFNEKLTKFSDAVKGGSGMDFAQGRLPHADDER